MVATVVRTPEVTVPPNASVHVARSVEGFVTVTTSSRDAVRVIVGTAPVYPRYDMQKSFAVVHESS